VKISDTVHLIKNELHDGSRLRNLQDNRIEP